jgi:hypothetical protein
MVIGKMLLFAPKGGIKSYLPVKDLEVLFLNDSVTTTKAGVQELSRSLDSGSKGGVVIPI